jgi:hypothetical protein
MKSLRTITTILFGLSLAVSAQHTKSAPACKSDDKPCQEIDRLEVEWNIINELSDPDGKERMLAFDSYHVGPSGRVYDKRADVAAAKLADQRRSPYASVRYLISGKRIRVYGNVAVVTGNGSSIVTEGGSKTAGRAFRFVHVWECREGIWYLTVDQVTAIEN